MNFTFVRYSSFSIFHYKISSINSAFLTKQRERWKNGYLKIIFGGQTDVDQAALCYYEELGILIGGWCPLGGLGEHGVFMLEQYTLKVVSGVN